MMNWEEIYSNKIVTAEKALSCIKDGDRVATGHAAGEPQYLLNILADKAENYKNVEVVHMVSLTESRYAQKIGHFRHNAIFAGAATRKLIKEGIADYTPSFFYEVPSLFEGTLPLDVAIVQTSLPDEQGNVSLGVSVDYTLKAAQTAKKVIIQINKYMPRTLGESFINLKDVDYIVKKDEPILEIPISKIGEVEKKIGKYCSKLIKDGDTLQLGIGAIPDAVLTFLGDKKDLGIHSEMISDGILGLIEKGVINNSKKQTFTGKSIVTFIMGSRKLYDYVDDNPDILFYPVDFVNHPVEIGKNDNLVSINSAIQIDLMGQVNAESLGYNQFSGTGGQVDFIRGAAFSKNGRAIIVLPSTASKGTISRIVPILDEGSAVTTTRNDVDYVVTEYGIAKLKGKKLRERGEELIKIAHPNFREELYEKYKKKFNKKD